MGDGEPKSVREGEQRITQSKTAHERKVEKREGRNKTKRERGGDARANQATDSADPRIQPTEAARSGPSASK